MILDLAIYFFALAVFSGKNAGMEIPDGPDQVHTERLSGRRLTIRNLNSFDYVFTLAVFLLSLLLGIQAIP